MRMMRWKDVEEVAMAYFTVSFQHLPRENEENKNFKQPTSMLRIKPITSSLHSSSADYSTTMFGPVLSCSILQTSL
jgi:hypothetical protein